MLLYLRVCDAFHISCIWFIVLLYTFNSATVYNTFNTYFGSLSTLQVKVGYIRSRMHRINLRQGHHISQPCNMMIAEIFYIPPVYMKPCLSALASVVIRIRLGHVSSGGASREITCWHQVSESSAFGVGFLRLMPASDLPPRTTRLEVFSFNTCIRKQNNVWFDWANALSPV